MSEAKNALNEKLEVLVQGLHPSAEYETKGWEGARIIYNALKESGVPGINRCIMSGSFGKGTAINDDSDFDVVVFLNKDTPPFTNWRLSQFEQSIRAFFQAKGNGWTYEWTRTTDFSVQFNLKYAGRVYNYDLLPAASFVSSTLVHGDPVSLQAQEVRRRLKSYPAKYSKRSYIFGSSLTDELLRFMKKQPPEVLKVVKLAKYWDSKLAIPKNRVNHVVIYGRSYLIELIAIKSQHGLETCNLLNRFICFLKLMKELSNLNITFDDYYGKSEIPSTILQERPLVLNPCLPFNNVAHKINQRNPVEVKIFEVSAEITLDLIQRGFVNLKDIFMGKN